MKQSTAKRFSIGLIPTTIILAAITLGFILLVTQNAAQPAVNQVIMEGSGTAPIKTRAELDAITQDLDTTNLDSLDGELQIISKESAAF